MLTGASSLVFCRRALFDNKQHVPTLSGQLEMCVYVYVYVNVCCCSFVCVSVCFIV